MSLIIKLLGILLILIGIFILIKPEFLYSWVDDNIGSKTLYISAIVFRLGLGGLLLFAAKSSRYPLVFRLLGALAILAAIIFLLIGHEGFKNFLSSFVPEFLPYSPVSALFSIALGGFYMYAFSNHKSEVQ